MPTPAGLALGQQWRANGHIYMFGGYDANNGGYLNTVQELNTNTTSVQVADPSTNLRWSVLPIIADKHVLKRRRHLHRSRRRRAAN